MLINAIERGDGNYELADVFERLLNNHCQLWIAIDDGELIAAMVTQISNFPRKRVLTVMYLAGKHRKLWMHFMEQIENWAKQQGCVGVEAYARKGLLKWLPDWRQAYVVIRRDFD